MDSVTKEMRVDYSGGERVYYRLVLPAVGSASHSAESAGPCPLHSTVIAQCLRVGSSKGVREW